MSDIILYDSPEACTKGVAKFEDGTVIVVFKAKSGAHEYLQTDERLARYAGCTHKVCPETGEVFEKTWVDGPTVRARKARERYLSYKQEARKFPIFIEDEFFEDLDELVDYYAELDEYDGLSGEICFAEKGSLQEVDLETIYGTCHIDDWEPDPSPELSAALSKLNYLIAIEDPGYYTQAPVRPTDEQLAEWDAEIRKARAANGGQA